MTDPHSDQVAPSQAVPLKATPLRDQHVTRGARMVPFAGYDMPVQYPTGILTEHLHTRSGAGLFDVSHMGQVALVGSDHDSLAQALETMCPADVLGLQPGRQRYSQLLAEDGGILDDFMVTRPAASDGPARLGLVLNASRKDADCEWIAAHLPAGIALERDDESALIALQGPRAAEVLARHAPAAANLTFMSTAALVIGGIAAQVSRSGYTGEDGYEISVAATHAPRLWDLLLSEPEVAPIGLGARDSLRLEAGLCLYGHDIDETTSPVEAGLVWSIGKRRRTEGGFPGAARIQRELAQGPARVRVGIRPDGRAPAREGAEIVDSQGRPIGLVTSGGFGPSLNAPVAMGYVPPAFAAPGTPVQLVVRGRALPAHVAALPFFPHRYHR